MVEVALVLCLVNEHRCDVRYLDFNLLSAFEALGDENRLGRDLIENYAKRVHLFDLLKYL